MAAKLYEMECPKCALVNPAGAERCDCGYDFDTGAGGGVQKDSLTIGYWLGPAALIAPFVITIPLLRLGIWIGLLAPAACGLASVVCGCLNLARGVRRTGIAQITIGIACGYAGTMLVLKAGVGLDR